MQRLRTYVRPVCTHALHTQHYLVWEHAYQWAAQTACSVPHGTNIELPRPVHLPILGSLCVLHCCSAQLGLRSVFLALHLKLLVWQCDNSSIRLACGSLQQPKLLRLLSFLAHYNTRVVVTPCEGYMTHQLDPATPAASRPHPPHEPLRTLDSPVTTPTGDPLLTPCRPRNNPLVSH